MTSSIDKEAIIDKWKSILESRKKVDHWSPIKSDYVMGVDLAIGTMSDNSFLSILPISMKIAAQTIGLNLVNVQPMGHSSPEELERIKGEVTQENRDRAIDSILDGIEFNPMKIEEHPDYNTGPKGKLFYMDYRYDLKSSGTFSLGEDNDTDI